MRLVGVAYARGMARKGVAAKHRRSSRISRDEGVHARRGRAARAAISRRRDPDVAERRGPAVEQEIAAVRRPILDIVLRALPAPADSAARESVGHGLDDPRAQRGTEMITILRLLVIVVLATAICVAIGIATLRKKYVPIGESLVPSAAGRRRRRVHCF